MKTIESNVMAYKNHQNCSSSFKMTPFKQNTCIVTLDSSFYLSLSACLWFNSGSFYIAVPYRTDGMDSLIHCKATGPTLNHPSYFSYGKLSINLAVCVIHRA